MKKYLFILLAALSVLGLSSSCSDSSSIDGESGEQQGTGKTENPEDMMLTIIADGDRVFSKKPTFTAHVENPGNVEAEAKIICSIITDTKEPVVSFELTEKIPANGHKDIVLTTEDDLEPGFYNANCFLNGRGTPVVAFGINPFDIVSAPDKQADFNEFWEAAKAQLAAVDMKVDMVEIVSKSNSNCKVYFVELQSVPDGPDGDPVLIHGYYLEPQDGQKHPVLMHFYGYDTLGSKQKVYCPSGDGKYAEFYLSHRGQYLNRTTADKREPDGKGDFENIYGDWFAYGFGYKDSYYYRGAFMDCVQAVNFMATRPTSDMVHLFAEGSSQGGALSYAVAALSDYPFTAIAPCVAFLGDYPDYFRIVDWPANVAKSCASRNGLSDEQMYAFLSYFDTKNLATRIPASTAVMACSGLLDKTCPPHTNIAPYNNLAGKDKEYYFYPKMNHEIPSDWSSKMMKFFGKKLK